MKKLLLLITCAVGLQTIAPAPQAQAKIDFASFFQAATLVLGTASGLSAYYGVQDYFYAPKIEKPCGIGFKTDPAKPGELIPVVNKEFVPNKAMQQAGKKRLIFGAYCLAGAVVSLILKGIFC